MQKEQQYSVQGKHGFVTQADLIVNLDKQTRWRRPYFLNLTADLDVEWATGSWRISNKPWQELFVRWNSFSVRKRGRKNCSYRLYLDGRVENWWTLTPNREQLSSPKLVIHHVYSTTTVPSVLALRPNNRRNHRPYNPNEAYLAGKKTVSWNARTLQFIKDTTTGISTDGTCHQWQADKRVAISINHGGPQVAYGESFFHEMQALAAKGYGVIMINPRGSNTTVKTSWRVFLAIICNHDFDDLMMG